MRARQEEHEYDVDGADYEEEYGYGNQVRLDYLNILHLYDYVIISFPIDWSQNACEVAYEA